MKGLRGEEGRLFGHGNGISSGLFYGLNLATLQSSAAGSTDGGNIAWYRFDEDSGTVLEDSSPNGRDAGIVGEESSGPGEWIPTHPGYLGALPEDTVVERGHDRVYEGSDNQVRQRC